MGDGKLSIIVPIYNVDLYLYECVESLLSQTYSNLEIILVNDGSSDNCGVICDELAVGNPLIKVIHQENKGLPHARNAGIEVATGDYIGFIDSDDYISKDMYKKMIELLEENGSDMVVCNFLTFNKLRDNPIQKRYKDETIVFDESNTLSFYQCALDSSCNKVYRRNIIIDNGLRFEDKSIVAQEDYWFLVRYCSHISKITTISEPYYHYRERKSSISKSRSDKDIVSRCLRFIYISGEYMKSYGREVDEFQDFLLLNLMFASINNTLSPTISGINDIVMTFKTSNSFDDAVNRKLRISKKCKTLRETYDYLLYYMMKKKYYKLFSVLESIRVKRLRSKNKTDIYFD